MITGININYSIDGVNYNLSIADEEPEGNLGYNLARMFARVVLDTNVNPAIVIEEMKGYLDTEE